MWEAIVIPIILSVTSLGICRCDLKIMSFKKSHWILVTCLIFNQNVYQQIWLPSLFIWIISKWLFSQKQKHIFPRRMSKCQHICSEESLRGPSVISANERSKHSLGLGSLLGKRTPLTEWQLFYMNWLTWRQTISLLGRVWKFLLLGSGMGQVLGWGFEEGCRDPNLLWSQYTTDTVFVFSDTPFPLSCWTGFNLENSGYFF